MLTFLLSITDEKYHVIVQNIYDEYNVEMYKVAAVILADSNNREHEAQEALQNAFLRIIEHIDKIDFNKKDEVLRSYFLTVATNEARRIKGKYRSYKSLKESVDDIDDYDFFTSIGIREDYDKVVSAIAELDDIYSIPLRLRYVEEMSVKDIAKLLDLKPNTVYVNINRGKIILKKKLGGEIKGYE